ncbi:methyltransferase, FxLD system, partial [Streptomyces sp. NPDC056632]
PDVPSTSSSNPVVFPRDTSVIKVLRRPLESALYEFGVIGHGPDAEALAGEVAAEIRTWDEERRDRPVAFTLLPVNGEPVEPSPGKFVIDTGFNRLVIEWQ